MKSKQECLAALQRANRYGDMTANQLAALTPAEREEFRSEVAAYMSGGQDDSSRDAAQAARLARLQSDLEAAL